MSFTPQQPHHDSSQAEAELMDTLLAASTSAYPWDPAEPAAADYYAAADRQFNLDDWSETEIVDRAQAFFSQIHSCWANSPQPDPEVSTLETLMARFGARVPQQWLEQIATNVSKLAASKLEPVERLVRSVDDLLSNWATEDLLVMARPYAYAMRCDPSVGSPDNVAPNVDWQQLTEVERAKLTIAIAQVAIDSIN